MLDKTDPPTVPDGYGLSVGFYCLVEAVRTIQLLVEGEQGEGKGKEPGGKVDPERKEKQEAAGDSSEEKGIGIPYYTFICVCAFSLGSSKPMKIEFYYV